jgi:L-2-hydroxyglutarate oxidase LhgO
MNDFDLIVIGAGVVGLAAAYTLSEKFGRVLVLEKNESYGMETSTHNSEVIHAGIYYSEEMLKTRLGVTGNPLLYQLCRTAGIPHGKTGKLVVAATKEDNENIERTYMQGLKNGVEGLSLVTEKEIQELEPNVHGTSGFYSTESGILDVRSLMNYFVHSFPKRGCAIFCSSEVIYLEKSSDTYIVRSSGENGKQYEYRAPLVINAAGLGAVEIAKMSGIDTAGAGYTLHPCKGEYFKVSEAHTGKLKHLVYPAPSPNHLGAHAVLSLDGKLKVGPSSFYVDEIDYRVDPEHQDGFYKQASSFLPFLDPEDLTPDIAGIRTKINGPGEPLGDFIIQEESDRGLPGFVNLIGIESPGLTACLSIAEYVGSLL